HFFAPRRIEEGAIHVLPQMFGARRILTDQPAGALFEHVARAALADTGYAGIGLDGDDEVALIEYLIWLRRRVCAHARDLHLGDCSARRPDGCDAGGCDGLEKRSAVHGLIIIPSPALGVIRA